VSFHLVFPKTDNNPGSLASQTDYKSKWQDLKFTLADRNGVAAEESFQHLQRTEHITPRDDAFDVRRVQGGKASVEKRLAK
jgi:hypothetical protein